MDFRNSCKMPAGILSKIELTDYNFLIGIVTRIPLIFLNVNLGHSNFAGHSY